MSKHVTDRLTAFIHGELGDSEVRAIEKHLARCAACRAELGELKRVDALAAGLVTVEPPDHLWIAIERELAGRDKRKGSQRWWIGAAVAALVILAVAIGIRGQRPDTRKTLDLATFLAALERQPRQDDSREFGLLPAGFENVDPLEAARAAGLGRIAGEMPAPDSQLFVGRVLEITGQPVYELIYGNAEGTYLLFVAPEAIEPDFGERRLDQYQAISPTCVRVASDSFSVFWDAGAHLHWTLVGRDHSDPFYAEVMRFVAEADRALAGTP